MKNNYSIAERNHIVEENLPTIDKVIRRNWRLMVTARLDYDDVYQDLAVRLIRCVENYDPDRGTLRDHIWAQLKYELLNCKTPRKRTGMTGLPYHSRWNGILSLDTLSEDTTDFTVA